MQKFLILVLQNMHHFTFPKNYHSLLVIYNKIFQKLYVNNWTHLKTQKPGLTNNNITNTSRLFPGPIQGVIYNFCFFLVVYKVTKNLIFKSNLYLKKYHLEIEFFLLGVHSEVFDQLNKKYPGLFICGLL